MDDLREKYLSLISEATDETSLENLRVQAVGKKGEISLQMRSLGKMSPEERQLVGPALNALKDEVNSALAARKCSLSDAALEERLKGEWLDVTLPGRGDRQGLKHRFGYAPITYENQSREYRESYTGILTSGRTLLACLCMYLVSFFWTDPAVTDQGT